MTIAHRLRLVVLPIVLAAGLSAAGGAQAPAPSGPAQPDPQKEARLAWFREAKYGLFIHWGLYALPAGEWKGVRVPGIGEWIMNRAKIPVREYEALAAQFNPVKFDADAWVQLAQDAGMKYIVITSKHHDGFALFDSKVSTYDIVDATPFKRDVLKELAAACAKRRMPLGFYYSQAQDWHEPNGAGNNWDFPPNDKKDFDQYLRDKAEPQVRELLTDYGPVALVWFDTPQLMTPARAQRFTDLVRSLQPQTLIDGRLGAEGDYITTGDNIIPGERQTVAWETPATINHTWGFRKDDVDWKRPGEIVFKLVDIVSKGGNYLLNVGPMADGVIPQASQDVLRAAGRWLKVNGEAVYGAQPTPFGAELGEPSAKGTRDLRGQPLFLPRDEYRITTKPGKLFITFFVEPRVPFELPTMQNTVKRAYYLATGVALPIADTNGRKSFTLPRPILDPMGTVIVVEVEGDRIVPPQPPAANYDESRVPAYTLPPLLVKSNGERVQQAADWTARREEIRLLLEAQMFGRAPREPGVAQYVKVDEGLALGGQAIRKQVTITAAGRPLHLLLYLPAKAAKPVPVFVGLGFQPNQSVHTDPGIRLAGTWVRNSTTQAIELKPADETSRGIAASRWPVEAIVSRGYGLATVYYGDIEPDHAGALSLGVRHPFLGPGQAAPADEEWGAIGAWAWGLSRMADYLSQDKDVDASRLIVVGHSRLGKTALWAGAQDPRFAMVISNDSGEGGAAISRRRFGETVADLNSRFPHWFCGNYKTFSGREDQMPFDAHMLLALAAPRPLYVASATDDQWADPRGEFLSAVAVSEVYGLFGKTGLGTTEMPPPDRPVGDTVRYHVRTGTHDITPYDWQQYLDFADRHLRR